MRIDFMELFQFAALLGSPLFIIAMLLSRLNYIAIYVLVNVSLISYIMYCFYSERDTASTAGIFGYVILIIALLTGGIGGSIVKALYICCQRYRSNRDLKHGLGDRVP